MQLIAMIEMIHVEFIIVYKKLKLFKKNFPHENNV